MGFDILPKARIQYIFAKLKTVFDNKVDKVTGKGLSTNDYTTNEKNKLAGIAEGATANVGTITGIKMNGASKGTSGVVDLGTVLTSHQSVTNKGATLAWSTISTIANIGGTDIKVTMPSNPNTDHYAWADITDKPSSYTPSAHTHGNIQNGGTLQTNDITIASGDKLVVTDSSDSAKVARTSISFDGSTATKCLTQKGTWESFTNNTGTVTKVKVGTTEYSPSSGVVSLPAYPTTLPASDVYSWAKASSKPSYTLDEVSDGSSRKLANYLPLSGGTMTGTIVTPANDTKGIEPASNNYGQIGSDSKWFYRGYFNTIYNHYVEADTRLTVGSPTTTATICVYEKYLSKYIEITPNRLSENRTITLPDKSGTIALTSDIPTVSSQSSSIVSGGTSVPNGGAVYSYLNSNTIPIKLASDVSEFNSSATPNQYKILYGLFSNTLYISFDISWIRLQFQVSGSNNSSIKVRCKYGESAASSWAAFV